MRIAKASIEEISASRGYPSPLHFSRAFKMRYGVSLQEWRVQSKGQYGEGRHRSGSC